MPSKLLSSLVEGFEGGVILASHWATVDGGSVGSGCGSLLPVAHGKNLYFNGCGIRQAITAEMDLTKARYNKVDTLMFSKLFFQEYQQFILSSSSPYNFYRSLFFQELQSQSRIKMSFQLCRDQMVWRYKFFCASA